MRDSLNRILAMLLRYFFLHKRSLPRTLEILFWPVMELLVWGFLTLYLKSLTLDPLGEAVAFLINAMIFWDILYRSQQGVSISFVEEMWTQNIINLLVSPLKIWEWLLSTFIYGMIKTLLITLLLSVLALGLYQFSLIDGLGFYAIALIFNLLLFGWALGIFTASLVIRFGHSAEALIWGIPYLLQPLSAIFYPLATLPPWLQGLSRCLPSTYVFEGMREVIRTKAMPMEYFVTALLLNIAYFLAAGFIFEKMYQKARHTGRLGRLGMD